MLVSVVFMAALLASSCAQVTTNSKSVLPTTSNLILPQALPGEKTQGCDHVLKVLHALQDYTNGQSAQSVAFEFTEAEVNEYLAYSLRIKPRTGVKGLVVRFFPDNEISVLATIDFAGVQKWNDWLIPETMRPSLLGAQRPVQVDIKFQASDGSGTFKLKDVVGPGNAAIPKAAMEWIIRAIALHQPEWYDTTRDISLPFRLQRVWTATQSLLGAT
ncbi:MAG TPA: hypothetical protein VG759_05965 [Candidatus Angelobacter sp.]|nr:hypothetical protein [Candidatus Angelobacter sp.]